MAKLIQIDPGMSISFTPYRNERISDATMVDLAEQMKLPNLLRCDTPLNDAEPLTLHSEAAAVLHWMQNHEKWRMRLEETLQSMCQDLGGRPFLTAFMPIEELEAFAKASRTAALFLSSGSWLSNGEPREQRWATSTVT
ncbi:hypothetical protein [Pseudomonas aeruginosa]